MPLWTGIALSFAGFVFFGMQALYWRRHYSRRERGELIRERVHGHEAQRSSAGIRIRKVDRPDQSATSVLAKWHRMLRLVLAQADLNLTPLALLSVVAASAGASSLLSLLFVEWTNALLLGLVLVLIAYGYVVYKRNARLKAFEDALPRAIESMLLSLRAGRGLEDAIRSASEEGELPLANELGRCYEEYVLGRPVEDSLEMLRQRWPSVHPLYVLVEAVHVLKKTGGNLVEVLETILASIRAQLAFNARHRALTAEGRLSARILLALPLLSVLSQSFLDPDGLRKMLTSPAGQDLMALAGTLWAVGALWITHLARPRRMNE